MAYWLMKSDVEDYSIDDLAKDKRCDWVGVRNYQARNFMRDQMRDGDMAFFYHSNANPSGIAGLMMIVGPTKPDPTQFDKGSKYYDEKATQEKPRWFLREVLFEERFPRLIGLSEIRRLRACQKMRLLQPGNRLSITPVTEKEFEALLEIV